MKKETSDKLLMKVAAKDGSVTLITKFVALNKQAATGHAKNPALTVIGDAAARDDAAFNNSGMSPAKPTAAQTMRDAMDEAGVERGTVKPSYLDVLKNRVGDAWDWTKGKWNQLGPEWQKSIGDVGLGTAGALTGDALVRALGGRKNKLMRLLGMVGGAGLGIAANSYLQRPDFKNTVNSGVSNIVNKLKG